MLKLKWPNDLLIDGNKFAGILVEGEGAGCGRRSASASIARIIRTDTGYPATDLAAAGVRSRRMSLFAALSARNVCALAQWDRGRALPAIRADWLTRAAGIGGAIRVRLRDRELAGRFEAIDDSGPPDVCACRRRRCSDHGRRRVHAGEVVSDGAGRSGTGVRAARRRRRDRHKSRALRPRRRAQAAHGSCVDLGVVVRAAKTTARHRSDHAGHPLSRGGAPQPRRHRAHPRA